MGKTVNADGSVTVDLKFPIKVENQETAQLTLKRIKGAQFRKINLAAFREKGDELLNVIGQLAAIPPSSLDQLDGEDILDLGKVVTGFLGNGPATGEAS